MRNLNIRTSRRAERIKRHMRNGIAMAVVCMLVPSVRAQEDVPADAEIAEQPPEVKAELEAQPSAVPTDDVMRPTEHVVRFTPKMARGMAKHLVNEFEGRNLSGDQRQEFEERLARRVMNVGHKHGKDLAPFFQTLFGEMMANQSEKIPPESARRIGELASRAAPAIRTFADGLAEDARPFLDANDYQELLAEEEKMKRAADRVQEVMDKWARGEFPEGDELENPFEIMEDAIENDGEIPEEAPDGRTDLRKQLDRQTEWSYWQKTPQGWRWFLQRARRTCDFTDEQYEQGMAILRDYEKRAEEIMTPEWKERIKRNRLLDASRHHLQDRKQQQTESGDGQPQPVQLPIQAQNIEPWLFQINVEFAQMTEPLDELKIQFTHDVMNLATPEQREAVAGELRSLASAHGMEPSMVEAAVAFLFQPNESSASTPVGETDESDLSAEPGSTDATATSSGGSGEADSTAVPPAGGAVQVP